MPPPGYFQQPPGGSQVPPGAPTPNPYGPRVDFEAIGTAWRMITADLGTWIVTTLIVLVITYALNMGIQVVMRIAFPIFGAENPFMPQLGASRPVSAEGMWSAFFMIYGFLFLTSLLLQALTMTLNVGIMEMAVRRLEGRPISVGDVFVGFNHFIPILGISLATNLLAAIGFFLCIVPMFLVYGVLSFAPLLIVRGRARGIDALGMSFNILKPHMWMMALLVFCAQLLSGLGVCACCIGALFTYSIFPITIGVLYSSFFPPAFAPRPQEGPSNYYRP